MNAPEKLIELAEAETLVRPAITSLRPSAATGRDFGSVWLDDVEIDGEPEWLVSQLLTSGAMSALWGDPGCGKSFLATHLGVCIAAGWEFLGKQTIRGGVVYVAAEGGRGITKRLVAIRERLGLPRGIPFLLIPTCVDLCTEHHETEGLIEEIQRAAEAMDCPIRLVVIDTLNRVMAGGNENDSQDMGALIRNGDRIREQTGAHLMFVHHGGKDRDRKTRGHSSFFGALDTAIEITVSETTGNRTGKVRKQKDGEDGITFAFRLEQVILNGSGPEPITSCVVTPAESTGCEDEAKRRRPNGVSAIALEPRTFK
jgi:RecA-family ATPase